MPTIRIPISITWTGASGSPGVNVWHGRVISLGGPASDVEDLTAMLDAFYTDFAVCVPPAVTFAWAGEALGVGDDAETVFTSPPWSVVGTGSSGFLPTALQYYVNWRTPSGGRNGRGRTFLGPLSPNTAETNGTPNDTYLNAARDAVDDLITTNATIANGALGVYSRQENIFRDFVSGEVPDKFAVLRSRRD